MARFLDLIQASRVHSWMRCFGHPLPKPSVFMSNIKDEIVGPLLRRQWSAKMEALWQKKLGAKLMSVMAIRNLWINKSKKCKTAWKFRWNREVKQSKYEKSFYRIHRSKSNNRKFVSGGKRLKRFWDLHSRFLPGCFRCLADSLPFTFQRIYFCRFISG